MRPPMLTLAALGVLAAAPVAAQPQPPSAEDFAKASAASNQFEITEAQIVLTASRDPRLREFAERMIADHTRAGEALKAAAARSGLPPPPEGMSADQSRLVYALQSVSGPELDRTYARQQALAHHQALVEQGAYAEAGGDANLRQAAAAAVPMIRRHLDVAQRLAGELGAGD